MALVYLHTNKLTNQKYVGITKRAADTRWREGLGYETQYFGKAGIQVFGWDGFEHEILVDGISSELATTVEALLIEMLETYNVKYGYNESKGQIIPDQVNEARKVIDKISREFPTIFTRTHLSERAKPVHNSVVKTHSRENLKVRFQHPLISYLADELFEGTGLQVDKSKVLSFSNDLFLAFGASELYTLRKDSIEVWSWKHIHNLGNDLTLFDKEDKSKPNIILEFYKKDEEFKDIIYRYTSQYFHLDENKPLNSTFTQAKVKDMSPEAVNRRVDAVLELKGVNLKSTKGSYKKPSLFKRLFG